MWTGKRLLIWGGTTSSPAGFKLVTPSRGLAYDPNDQPLVAAPLGAAAGATRPHRGVDRARDDRLGRPETGDPGRYRRQVLRRWGRLQTGDAVAELCVASEARSRRPCARAARRTRRRRSPASGRARAGRRSSGTSTCGLISDGAHVRGRVRPVRPRSCCQSQPSSTIFSIAASKSRATRRVGVLVDRHARGRVRHVDERGRGAVDAVRAPRATCGGDVEQLRPPLASGG